MKKFEEEVTQEVNKFTQNEENHTDLNTLVKNLQQFYVEFPEFSTLKDVQLILEQQFFDKIGMPVSEKDQDVSDFLIKLNELGQQNPVYR